MKKKVAKIKKVQNEKVVMISAMIIFGFALVLVLFSWWQTSGWTYAEFKDICDANGGGSCMTFYWRQYNYYQNVWLGSLYVTMVSAGVAFWAWLKKR